MKKIFIAIVLLILGIGGLALAFNMEKKEAVRQRENFEIKVLDSNENQYPIGGKQQSPQEPATVDDLIQDKEGKKIMDILDIEEMLKDYEIE